MIDRGDKRDRTVNKREIVNNGKFRREKINKVRDEARERENNKREEREKREKRAKGAEGAPDGLGKLDSSGKWKSDTQTSNYTVHRSGLRKSKAICNYKGNTNMDYRNYRFMV